MTTPIDNLRGNIRKVFFGDPEAVDRAITCLLARGHLLIEDVPGVGKTMLATAIARSVDCSFSRIQLTPDLLPADVLGVSIFRRDPGEFSFQPGPIFANVVLADEINRASPRTQSAMLEAMNEATVSIDGTVHRLDQPFIVIATQNPFEFEGTHPLPENQLDRFLMRLELGYPTAEAEARMLEERPATTSLQTLDPVMDKAGLIELQQQAERVKMDQSLLDYIVQLATATREHEALRVGVSPRGALALAQASRATALVRERDYCVPEDITDNVVPVCAHRVVPRSRLGEHAFEAAVQALGDAMQRVPSPV
ncbi:MAG: AAA family ATPase [Phycisphaerales bacterium]